MTPAEPQPAWRVIADVRGASAADVGNAIRAALADREPRLHATVRREPLGWLPADFPADSPASAPDRAIAEALAITGMACPLAADAGDRAVVQRTELVALAVLAAAPVLIAAPPQRPYEVLDPGLLPGEIRGIVLDALQGRSDTEALLHVAAQLVAERARTRAAAPRGRHAADPRENHREGEHQ